MFLRMMPAGAHVLDLDHGPSRSSIRVVRSGPRRDRDSHDGGGRLAPIVSYLLTFFLWARVPTLLPWPVGIPSITRLIINLECRRVGCSIYQYPWHYLDGICFEAATAVYGLPRRFKRYGWDECLVK